VTKATRREPGSDESGSGHLASGVIARYTAASRTTVRLLVWWDTEAAAREREEQALAAERPLVPASYERTEKLAA
jgi:hypothetical protein